MTKTLSKDDAEQADTVTEPILVDGEPMMVDGEEVAVEVVDITIGELERLEDLEREGDASRFDIVRKLWGEYIVPEGHDEVPDDDAEKILPTNVPRRRVEPITKAMYRAWGAADSDIDAAMQDLETPDEGN